MDTFSKSLKSSTKRLQRQIDLINQVMSSTDQLSGVDVVNNEVSSLDKMYSDVCDIYARVVTVLTDNAMGETSETYVSFATAMEEAESKYFEIKTLTCQHLLRQEVATRSQAASREGSVKSKHSSRSSSKSSHSSRHSSRSSRSSASQLSLKQRAKVQGLKAEVEAVIATNEAELNAKVSRLQQKIKKEEAKEKVYREEIASRGAVPKSTVSALNEGKSCRNKTEQKEDGNRVLVSEPHPPSISNVEVQLAMVDLMKLQCAPRPDIDIFSGDPLEFHYFRATFREVVESTVLTQSGRLTRLIQKTSGDAKELIKHLVHADPDTCYDRAMSLLEEHYGNVHLVSSSYLKELRDWEIIKQNDAAGFKRFFRFLLKCQAYKAGSVG